MADPTELRRALLITSGWLASIATKFKLDEATTRAIIRHDGQVIADTTLGEALDIANSALEPERTHPLVQQVLNSSRE